MITKTACAFIVAKVLSVHDGDTFNAKLECQTPFFCESVSVRVDGIDTPEIDSKIPWLAARAQAARNFTYRQLMAANTIKLVNCHHDKYGGRIDADVMVDDQDLGKLLINSGHGRIYTGRGPKPWPDEVLP